MFAGLSEQLNQTSHSLHLQIHVEAGAAVCPNVNTDHASRPSHVTWQTLDGTSMH